MRLEGDDWRTFFDSYQREAFRLETLPSHGVGSEQEEYEKFLMTRKLNITDDDPWPVRVRRFRHTGRWIGQVHVISQPLTDYLRYEFAVYRHTVEAGEDVRILDLTDQPDPGPSAQHFWLFDDTAIVRMDYGPDGTQLGRELLEDTDPAPYVAWKRLALEYAEPFTENWVKREGRNSIPHAQSRIARTWRACCVTCAKCRSCPATGLPALRDESSKVSRIETGRLLPSVVDVEQVLTALEVDNVTRRELLALARIAEGFTADSASWPHSKPTPPGRGISANPHHRFTTNTRVHAGGHEHPYRTCYR